MCVFLARVVLPPAAVAIAAPFAWAAAGDWLERRQKGRLR